MASCTRPVTAINDDERSDSSTLTPPPDSPSVAAIANNVNTITVDATAIVGKFAPRIKSIEANGDSSVNGSDENNADAQIRPYVDPASEFAYYDKVDDREASVATRRNSEEPEESKSSTDLLPEAPSEEKADVKPRYPFPKFTSLEVFDDYLGNHEDLSYEDLYHRTAIVAEVLVKYQKEWDVIGKEIDDHEAYVKAQTKIAADKSKASEEEKTKVDDQRYLELAQEYKAELKLSRSDWDRWLEELQAASPDQSELHDSLRNLRNPTFLMAIHKRQKVSHVDSLKLANRPILQDRVTKEEIAAEKRKRYGRLLDPVTFDDMKHADAYGFNYSSQPHHVGNQPQPSLNDKVKGRGVGGDEGRGGRSQRALAKRSYDADKSVTPETDEEELPAKRARKVRNLDAGIDFQARARTGPHSRSGTPAVRVFPSGKRVGRPPTKSKLKEVQHPPPDASTVLENGAAPRKLAPKQEELLHESVESLVNQTQPRRMRRKSTGDSSQSPSATTSRPSTSSSHEPRSRKIESNNTEPDTLVVEGPPSQSTLPPPVATKRKRKVKEEDIDESLLDPEQLEALRKKRIKSQKLSESLRKRWEKGEMKVAMESRKATNAKKKAAKLEAKQQAEIAAGVYAHPMPLGMGMAPAIIPSSFLHMAPHAHPQVHEQFQLHPQPTPLPMQPIPPPPQYQLQPQPHSQSVTPIATPPYQPPKRKSTSARKPSAKGKAAAKTPIPTPPLPRELGKRKRRPTKLAIDGASDDSDDAREQLHRESEYDRFQQISNSQPGSPDVLPPKRARKNRIDLAAVMDDVVSEDDVDDGEEEYYSS